MNTWVEIVIVIVAFYMGVMFGFFIRGWFLSKHTFDGIIQVVKDDDKMVYSLELHEDPNMLEYMKEVIFKVVTSEENPDRS